MSEEVDSHIVERYDIQKRLGKGAYGIVWKAVDRRTNEAIALKKIFDAFRNATDAQRTFREIMFLQEFGRHPNVIKLYNILKADNDKFLHSGNVLHRDLKPSNVLLDAECRVKLADFGLARSFSQMDDTLDGSNVPELTEYVATRWYRSPEILLAAKHYTKGVDMWSLGCILAEMLLGKALFPGSSTINQIERIMNTIQRPSKNDIESIGSAYASSVLEKMPQWPKKPLDIILAQTSPEALDLVSRLLIFAPHKRLNVEQCLEHPYVSQFHNKAEEPSLDYEVRLPLPDHIQLSVHEYRDKLYEIISTKKVNIQRINYPNINDKSSNDVKSNGWVEKQQNGEIKEQRRQSTTTQPLKEHEKEKTTNEAKHKNKRVQQRSTTSPLPAIQTKTSINKQQTQQQESSPTDSEKTPKHTVKGLKSAEKKNNLNNINGGLKQQKHQQQQQKYKNELGSSPSVERNTSGHYGSRKTGLVINGTASTMSRSMSESKGLNQNGGSIHQRHQEEQNQAPIALAEPSDTDLDTSSSTSSALTMGTGTKITGSNGTLRGPLDEHHQQNNNRRSFGNLFSNIIQNKHQQQHSNNLDDVSVIRARAQSIESSTTNYPSKFSLRARSREKIKSSSKTPIVENGGSQQHLYIDGKQKSTNRRSHDRLRIFSALRPSKTSVNN
uniref:mitogen-activated protein kinase n=1 Tax=Meloidogyne hapla TaxID=6305 RepID=A0A1I8B4M7_MELHA